MASSVRIEDEAFSDSRYDRLAVELGLPDADCARGKMARIWRQCTIEQRYELDVKDVITLLGDRGPDALVLSRLGEINGDSIRIKGTKGRIEWLKKLRKNGKFGKMGGRPKKNPRGFPKEPLRVPESDQNKTPPAPAPAPVSSSSTTPKKSVPAAEAITAATGRMLSSADQDRLRALLPLSDPELEYAVAETRKAPRPSNAYCLTILEDRRKNQKPDEPSPPWLKRYVPFDEREEAKVG